MAFSSISRRRLRILLALACYLAVPPAASAQESAWSLKGDIITGFATNYVEDGTTFRNSATPFNLLLDLEGYLAHPDFLSFSFAPQYLAGEAAPQAGFGGQNGYRTSVNFLRRRAMPLTVSYSNYRLDTMSYGALLGIDASRYRTRYEDVNLLWQWNFRKLPRITWSAAHANSRVQPELVLLPTQFSRDNSYGVTLDYVRWGWSFEGEGRRARRALDSVVPPVSALASLSTDQDSKWGSFRAQKRFAAHNSFTAAAGRRDVDELLDHTLPLHHGGYHANLSTSLDGGAESRWSALLQTGYNSDRSAIYSGGPLPVVPGSAILSYGISTLNASSDLRYRLHKNWDLLGGLHWTRTHNDAPTALLLTGDTLGSNAGVDFHRPFSWGHLSSSYSLSYLLPLSAPPAADFRTIGHTFNLQAVRGNLDRLEMSATVSAGVNRVTSDIFLQRREVQGELGLARRWRSFVFRGRAGYRDTQVLDFSEFNSHDWSFQMGAEHHRFNARYFRNQIGGTTLTLAGISAGNPVLRRFLSASRNQGVSVSLMPWRNLHAQASWVTLGQNLDNTLQNRSHYLDSSLGYNFRMLSFDVGYARYDQALLGFPGLARSSFYVRFRRAFRVF